MTQIGLNVVLRIPLSFMFHEIVCVSNYDMFSDITEMSVHDSK